MKWKTKLDKNAQPQIQTLACKNCKCIFRKLPQKTLKLTYNLPNLLVNLAFVIKHCELLKYCIIIIKGSWENKVYKDIQFLISVKWQILFKPNEFM